jgi:hypothetical protein
VLRGGSGSTVGVPPRPQVVDDRRGGLSELDAEEAGSGETNLIRRRQQRATAARVGSCASTIARRVTP